MMRAIVIKELRENAVWALLMLLGLGGAFAFAAHAGESTGYSLVSNSIAMITALGFSVVGLALGLLQVLQDHRQGRWGFLTHRPISRTGIFFGKVIAGVVLYLLATVAPLGGLTVWVATPGHVAVPFDWHMVLPRLADLFGGLMWYATGLLIAGRKARWIGSRLMPIGLAVMVAAFAWVFPLNLLEALLIHYGGIGLFLLAAWGAFNADGVFESQPIAARSLQVLSIGTGIALSLALFAGILVGTVEMIHPPSSSTYETYEIDTIGRVMRVTYDSGRTVQVINSEGQTLSSVDRESFLRNPLSAAYLSLEGYPTEKSTWQDRRDYWGLQGANGYLRFVGDNGSTAWFYVVRRRTIEGFDRRSRSFVGSFGPDGFAPASQSPQPFPEMLFPQMGFSPVENIAGRTAVYQLDPEARKIIAIFKTSEQDPVLSSSMDFKNGQESALLDAIATRTAVHVMDDDREVCRIPLEHAFTYHNVAIGQVKDGRFILRYTNAYSGNAARPDLLVETDAGGRILRRTELPLLSGPVRSGTWLTEGLQMLSCPPLILGVAAVTKQPVEQIDVIAVGLVAVIGAIATALLCRRYGFGIAAGLLWVIFSLLTGLAGPLSILALYHLPAKVKCPACGKKRIVSRELCEHCGVSFTKPAMEGIEIFEMV